MTIWLIPIALFWPLAALYLGGAPVQIEGGGGGRQVVGLLLHFGLFLAVWAVSRLLLTALGGGILPVVVPVLLAVALLPSLARVAFRLVGVHVRNVEQSPNAA